MSLHHLTFTEEEKECKRFLENCGIKETNKFICLVVRDNAYLNLLSLNYHSHRDCDIDNFVLVAEELAKMGYFEFLEMGHL